LQIQKAKPGYKKFKKLLVIPRFIDFTIPELWEVFRLDELSIEIKDGPMGFGLHTYDYVEKGIPVLRIQNLKNLTVTKDDLRYISEEKHEELKKSQVNPLDIIISKTGVLGMIGVVSIDYGPANLNQALARITLKDKKMVPFVSSFLSSKIPQQILSVVGSGRTVQAGLKLSDIKNLEIPIPPLDEQQKIDTILLNVDSLIQQYDSIIESTKKIKTGLMQQLLTKGIGHTKFKKVKWLFGKEIEIPEEWNVEPLEKVLEIVQYGISKPLSSQGKYPIFRMNSIQKGEVIEMDMKFIDLDSEEFEKYKLEKGDLLFNRTNSYDLVGKIGIFLFEGDYTFAGYLIRLKTNEKMNPVFLNNYLNTLQSQYRVKRFATPGVSQTNINASNLKSIEILVPKRKEQNKIALILDRFDSKIKDLKSKKFQIQNLKKGLLQKLLTGQIRV